MEKTVQQSRVDYWVARTCVVVFLIAIVAANMVVNWYGQKALPFTAFFLIPFDMLTRDILHRHWYGRNLFPKMLALILTGGLLSMITVDPFVGLASMSAFLAATTTNTVVYHCLFHRPTMIKMNVSNFAAAIADSIVFPLMAFDSVDWRLCVAQTLTKFSGGLLFSYLWVVCRYDNCNMHKKV